MRRIKWKKHLYLYLAVAIIVIAAIIYSVVRLTRHNGPVIPSTNPLQASSTSGSKSNPAASSSPSSPGSSATSNSTSTSGPPPITPYGDFVSSHHPSGSSTEEASTCNTSPGAVCYIQFTKGSDVKKLDPHTTDARGGAIWYWKLGDAGLSSGSWTITAVATLNGQTKSANDAQPLVIP